MLENTQEIVYIPSDSSNEQFTTKQPAEQRNSGETTDEPPNDVECIPLAQRIAHKPTDQQRKTPSEDSNDINNEEQDYQPRDLDDDEEPKTIEQALSGPYAQQWTKAMVEELESLKQNETWYLEPIPRNKTAIGCKWVFKVKKSSDNTPDRFKARLVAQGFSQKFGIDYEEVFAPVVKATTIRTLLSIAEKRKYLVQHLDVKTAFLNGKLKEIIFMKQPPGHIKEGKEDFGCRLNKSLYGLKQSAKSWYEKLDETLTNYSFVRCDSDPCLYKHGNSICTYLVVHVDDIMIAGSSKTRIDNIITVLNHEFSLTNLGDIRCYLGVQVTRTETGDFSIHQQNYINKILIQTRLNDAKLSNYPMDTEYEKNRLESPELKIDYYSKLIGKLLYIYIDSLKARH